MEESQVKMLNHNNNETVPFSAQVVCAGPRKAEETRQGLWPLGGLLNPYSSWLVHPLVVLTWGKRVLAPQSWRTNGQAGLALSAFPSTWMHGLKNSITFRLKEKPLAFFFNLLLPKILNKAKSAMSLQDDSCNSVDRILFNSF